MSTGYVWNFSLSFVDRESNHFQNNFLKCSLVSALSISIKNYSVLEGKIGVEPTFLGFADRAVTIPAHFPINWVARTDIGRKWNRIVT